MGQGRQKMRRNGFYVVGLEPWDVRSGGEEDKSHLTSPEPEVPGYLRWEQSGCEQDQDE